MTGTGGAVTAAFLALDAVVLVLLFGRPASRWFGRGSSALG